MSWTMLAGVMSAPSTLIVSFMMSATRLMESWPQSLRWSIPIAISIALNDSTFMTEVE